MNDQEKLTIEMSRNLETDFYERGSTLQEINTKLKELNEDSIYRLGK
jgi:hypothetical protein